MPLDVLYIRYNEAWETWLGEFHGAIDWAQKQYTRDVLYRGAYVDYSDRPQGTTLFEIEVTRTGDAPPVATVRLMYSHNDVPLDGSVVWTEVETATEHTTFCNGELRLHRVIEPDNPDDWTIKFNYKAPDEPA